MKWRIALSVLMWLSRLSAAGQVVADGTVVVVSFSQNEIVIATDGREMRGGGTTYSDNYCKVVALGSKVIFAASGRGGRWNGFSYDWNARTLARDVFAANLKKGTTKHISSQLARDWGIAMKKKLEEDIAMQGLDSLRNTEENTYGYGVFGNFEKDGSLLVVVESIAYTVTNGTITVTPTAHFRSTTPKGSPLCLGKCDISNEGHANQTARAKEWNRQFDIEEATSPDPIMLQAQYAVKLTIQHHPATHLGIDGKKFSDVGGPITVAKLTRKGITWAEPGACPVK
jgi:hypothetical protein